MKKSTVGETVLSFIFIFKGRRADFLIGNMKKENCVNNVGIHYLCF